MALSGLQVDLNKLNSNDKGALSSLLCMLSGRHALRKERERRGLPTTDLRRTRSGFL